MKGGKAGRPKQSAGANKARQNNAPAKVRKGDAARAAQTAPKKGSRKKSFGGTSTRGEE